MSTGMSVRIEIEVDMPGVDKREIAARFADIAASALAKSGATVTHAATVVRRDR